MKKFILSFIAAVGATTAIAQIPNAGFESWTSAGSYEVPDSWGTMNHASASYSVYTATKAAPGNPGSSYLKLTSKTTGTAVTNGIAVSGRLDTVTLRPKSGFAFTQRPASLTGKWQHMIYGSSQGAVKVLTTRWNAGTNSRDTIAHAEQNLSGMAMSWANFSINLTYMDAVNTPDSCIIVLQASGANPANNDYLWVDNLAFTGTVTSVGVGEIQNASGSLSAFPNPARDYVQISCPVGKAQTVTIELMDLSGKLIYTDKKEATAGELKAEIDVRGLAKSAYLLKLSGADILQTTKILVE